MPKYKVMYFNGRGRAEISRLILSYGKADWEDFRTEFPQWPELKPKMPLGTLPCLEVDGKLINNSGSMQRYLAQEFGLFGDDAITRAQIDVMADYITDVGTTIGKLQFEKDETVKKEGIKTFFSETLPPVLEKLEKILAANGNRFLVGKSVSLADIVAYQTLWQMSQWSPGLLDKHQLLKSHGESIGSLPNIKAWVDKRPKTEF